MENLLNTADTEWYRQRITGAMVVALFFFSVLFIRLFYLQIIKGEEFRQLSDNNSIRLQAIDPPRGYIYDRNGRLLVDNRPAFDLYLTPKYAKPVDQTLRKLAHLMNTSPDVIIDKVHRRSIAPYKAVLVKKDIGRDMLAAVEVHRYDLPGISININSLRHYRDNNFGAHIIGYLGEISATELNSEKYPDYRRGDYIGKFGTEKTFESYLRGERGGRQVQVDATGQIVRVLKTVSGKPGRNIYLTIDAQLQQKAEALLEKHTGAIVAMEPSTGEILALASSPSFDQNLFVSGMTPEEWRSLSSNPYRPMENKAVQGQYPPASTYKIITALAGLEEGVIGPNTTFFCPGHYRFGDRDFHCWKKHGHGNMNVVSALAESCDVFFYHVGQRLGVDRLAYYAKACGLGHRTGIELDREARGLIPTANWKKKRFGNPWREGETLSLAIGQGYNLATPLQMLGVIAAVANDGVRYKPQLLKKVESADRLVSEKRNHRIAGRIPVKKRNLQLVQKGLWEVVNGHHGTARRAQVEGVEVCGKTGTAQIVSRKTGEREAGENLAEHLKPHAWFVAYAPFEQPRIAVSVIVEHGESGSRGAAPLAREIIHTYLTKEKKDITVVDAETENRIPLSRLEE